MRSLSLSAFVALPVAGLISLVACATSPVDPLPSRPVPETNDTTPDDQTKLPPPSNPPNEDPPRLQDAGKKDSSTPVPDSGTPPVDSGGPGPTPGVCDVSDGVKMALWFIELSQQETPVPCPCASGKCCYLGITCLTAY